MFMDYFLQITNTILFIGIFAAVIRMLWKLGKKGDENLAGLMKDEFKRGSSDFQVLLLSCKRIR